MKTRWVAVGCLGLVACLAPVEQAEPLQPRAQGAVDASVDAGSSDGGSGFGRVPDAGERDAGGFDASSCSVALRASPEALASTPRSEPQLELLVLHGAPGAFVVDDDTYQRATLELAQLRGQDAGAVGFVPTWGSSVLVQFDDAGAQQVTAGDYHAWDCLNGLYRGQPQMLSDGLVVVTMEPVVALPQLAEDYAALPNVVSVEQNAFGVCASCGCASDVCLDIKRASGEWTWLGHTQLNTCGNDWYRLRTQADGGARFETRPGAPLPRDWLDASPRCWDALWATQGRRDGG